MMSGLSPSCPNDPTLTPLTSSLYHATSTIDDLTAALAESRLPTSLVFLEGVTCCFERDNCKNLKV
jgi:hypothetical protein